MPTPVRLAVAGSAASTTKLSNTDNPVTVTVGGENARVLFAGLAPGFVGLYQVNVIVPSGIAAADDVPVVLTEAGATSAPVTVAIQ
jgi:minor extracellular serine protease Vpr